MRIGWGVRIFAAVSAAVVWLTAAVYGAGPRNATIGVAVTTGLVFALIFGTIVYAFVGTLVHELGHAIAGVLLSPGRALVEIGAAPRPWRFRFGRIDLNLGSGYGAAHCTLSGQRTPRRQVIISAAGPLASVLYGAALLVAAWRLHAAGHGTLALLALQGAVIQAGVALWNLKSFEFDRPDDAGRPRRMMSDGARIRQMLRQVPAPEPPSPRAPLASRAQLAIGTGLRLARQEGDSAVTTEHVLRGAAASDSTARDLLRRFGYSTRDEVPPPQDAPMPPPAPDLQGFMEKVYAQRSLSGHVDAELEHVLLAIVRSPACSACAALVAAGVDVAALRAELVRSLT